jgi:hypothetical protein
VNFLNLFRATRKITKSSVRMDGSSVGTVPTEDMSGAISLH